MGTSNRLRPRNLRWQKNPLHRRQYRALTAIYFLNTSWSSNKAILTRGPVIFRLPDNFLLLSALALSSSLSLRKKEERKGDRLPLRVYVHEVLGGEKPPLRDAASSAITRPNLTLCPTATRKQAKDTANPNPRDQPRPLSQRKENT
jgi:hypothetical protein